MKEENERKEIKIKRNQREKCEREKLQAKNEKSFDYSVLIN